MPGVLTGFGTLPSLSVSVRIFWTIFAFLPSIKFHFLLLPTLTGFFFFFV
jgi:hypothetical protein